MTRATVLVPTFDHGPTLNYAVRSALDQTVADIEVFIVGDGVPPLARGFIEELVGEDSRVRLFTNDKGPRHGEIHRARALEEASGEIVCYLSDDDLWLPDHLEVMRELLEEADFAHCLPVRVEPDGSIGVWPVDLTKEADRELLLSGENRIPLSCSGHTLAAYRRLPHGWRTTPDNVPTDLYMFQQFLVHRLRARSAAAARHVSTFRLRIVSTGGRSAAWLSSRCGQIEWPMRNGGSVRSRCGCWVWRPSDGRAAIARPALSGGSETTSNASSTTRPNGWKRSGLVSNATRTRWCS